MNLGKENELVEFKESTSELNKALESIVAMLNKHSTACIYFGVKDNGDIKGQLIGKDTLNDISKAITTKIKPIVIPFITTHVYKEKAYIKVETKGFNKPYCVDGLYLIRSGAQNLKLDPDTMRDLIYSNEGDLMIEQTVYNQQPTFIMLKQLFLSKELTLNEKTFKKNLNLLTRNKKYNLLADVLSDNNNFSIKVCRFEGKDKSKLIERQEFGNKCLLIAMQQALNHTNLYNETKVELGKFHRKETKLFDEECLKEAWINACLHNKWIKGVPPVINIFDDRIEILSTGGLPPDFDKKDFFLGTSRPVNPALQKIMGQLDIVEQTGHGVPTIVKKYGKEAFKLSSGFITVVLKFAFQSRLKRIQTDGLSKNESLILNEISVNPNITTYELMELTHLSQPTIARCLKRLKLLNKIDRVGSNKTGYWKLLK